MSKLAITATLAMLGIAVLMGTAIPAVQAAEVHCKAVMKELKKGKQADEVAADMNIPPSSVFECLRKANKAEVKREALEHAAKVRAGSSEASPSGSQQNE